MCETKSTYRTECSVHCVSRRRTSVFLTNGFQMRGIVRGFDSFVVILESDGKQQMIYKHAISTLIPQHRVDLHAPRGERAEQ